MNKKTSDFFEKVSAFGDEISKKLKETKVETTDPTDKPLPVQLADTRTTKEALISDSGAIVGRFLIDPWIARACLKSINKRYPIVPVLSKKDIILTRMALASILPIHNLGLLIQPYVKKLGR